MRGAYPPWPATSYREMLASVRLARDVQPSRPQPSKRCNPAPADGRRWRSSRLGASAPLFWAWFIEVWVALLRPAFGQPQQPTQTVVIDLGWFFLA